MRSLAVNDVNAIFSSSLITSADSLTVTELWSFFDSFSQLASKLALTIEEALFFEKSAAK